MNQFFCRAYQTVFGVIDRSLPDAEQERIEGVDSFLSIPDLLEQEGKVRPMIVTGPRIAKSEFLKALLNVMPEATLLYDKVTPDPTVELVELMVKEYIANECDSIVAIGGGSNMDAAKAMAARVVREDKTLQQLGGLMKVRKETPFFIAVPTTAGTGSEITVAAVITDEKTHHKYAINDPVLIPNIAVLDPSLTVSLPADLTAQTGMDALTHAVEAYLNTRYHKKETKELCEEAVEGIFEFLPRAYENPEDLEAREELLIASYKAGAAFSVACVGNVHAIAHTIGGIYHKPHGFCNAVILPIVLSDYGSAIDEPLARLADLTGVSEEGSSDSEKAKAFIDAILHMNETMGIPDCIPDIEETDIKRMAEWANKEANPLYPVPVIYSKAHFERVLRKIKGNGKEKTND